ncbi:MAG: anaerobic ribonucleoside-triphosphate reductase activating protein [Oscillospiraceae bacterium]|jgi:anaerobic ribonucleoside-triphosphate reductase activating protein|nr:anaerobic ribonucleoside-triphosphate reductase activating protein [Oscillospiraceae bacterium]
MSEMKLRVAGLVIDSIVDGAGLRLSVFVQGCPHHCLGCHNPQSHDPLGGKEMPIAEIAAKAARNPLLSGITLTGGEPLAQAAACLALVRALPESMNVWLYTGYTYEEIMESGEADKLALLDACDVLVDGRFVLAERSLSLMFRGSRNQRVIDLRRTRAQGTVVWLEGYEK